MVIKINNITTKEQHMPIFDENEKLVNQDNDELPLLLDNQDVPKDKSGFKSLMKNLPAGLIVAFILIIILGIMVVSLGAKVSSLSADLAKIEGIKTQLSSIASRLEELNMDKVRVKSSLTQMKGDIETLKIQKEKVEAQLKKQQQPNGKKKLALKKTKPAGRN